MATDLRTLVILPSAKRKETSAAPLPTEIPEARRRFPKKRNRDPQSTSSSFSFRPAPFSGGLASVLTGIASDQLIQPRELLESHCGGATIQHGAEISTGEVATGDAPHACE